MFWKACKKITEYSKETLALLVKIGYNIGQTWGRASSFCPTEPIKEELSMAFNFEELKKRANDWAQQAADLAQQGAAMSRQLAGIAKLKAANLGEEDTIRKAYAELGKIYFAKYGEHPEDEFAAACETIIEAQAAIAANNATIEEMSAKKEEDVEVEIIEVDETEGEAAEEAPAEEAAEEAPAEEAPAEEAAAEAGEDCDCEEPEEKADEE